MVSSPTCHRNIPKFLTGLAGIFQIFAFQPRATFHLLGRRPVHEWHIQRPPGDSKERHPYEREVQEETKKRQPAIKTALQHHNIHPGLVVTVDQIAAFAIQSLRNLDIPLRQSQYGKQHVVD